MENTDKMDLISLPNELLIDIFDYLPHSDLQHIRMVCKYFRDVTNLPKFAFKSKLTINSHNLGPICEYFKNDMDFSKMLAHRTLHLHEVEFSDDLQQALKCLGTCVSSLHVYKSEVLSLLNECFPQLENLYIMGLHLPESNIANFDLRKFKHLKTLDINHCNIPHFAILHFLHNLVDDPPFKMKKMCLAVSDNGDDEELVISVLQHHCSSLKNLEIVFCLSPNLMSEWKRVFKLLTKLENLSIKGHATKQWLSEIFESLPQETPLRNCDLAGNMEANDKILKFVVEKWSDSLSEINLGFCKGITDRGLQHLAKLKHRLKSLNLAYCRHLTADKLLDGLAAEKNTVLRCLVLNDSIRNEYMDVLAERLPELRFLVLDNCRKSVDDYTLQSIFQHQLKIRYLNLNECSEITDDGLVGFGSSPASLSNLEFLHTLIVRGCYKITDRALTQSFKLKNLRQLVIGYCHNITSRGLKDVAKNCPLLEDLTLSSCTQIDDDAMLFVVQGIKGLKQLNVSNCTKITSKSLDHIIQHCKYLKKVGMWEIESLNEPGLEEKFQQLKELNIDVQITNNNIREMLLEEKHLFGY